MSYSQHVAKTVSDQLERFVTLNDHQLAGHIQNLDFWIGEVRHALDVIDGYQDRFGKLKAGQVAAAPDLLRRVPDSQLRDARRAVVDSLYRFLIRLWKARLLTESRLRSICRDMDIGIDLADLRPKSR
jgi:hypothetical protein